MIIMTLSHYQHTGDMSLINTYVSNPGHWIFISLLTSVTVWTT